MVSLPATTSGVILNKIFIFLTSAPIISTLFKIGYTIYKVGSVIYTIYEKHNPPKISKEKYQELMFDSTLSELMKKINKLESQISALTK